MNNRKAVILFIAAGGLAVAGWTGWRLQQPGAVGGPLGTPAVNAATGGADRPPSAANAPGTGGVAATPAGGGGAAGAGPRGPVGVEVSPATQMAVADDVSAVGTLRANESVVVKPEIAGRVAAIGFTDGARIRPGAMLVELDASVPAAELEQVRAERALALAKYERAVELAQKNFVSAQARDEAGANLQVVDARLALARARLDKSRIVAPFGGIVGLRNVAVGDFVKDGAELVTLDDTSSMKVDLRLSERVIGQLRRGQALEVAVDALPGRMFRASIEALDATVDANGRSILVRGRIPNPDGVLRTGMFARARVVLQQREGAVTVPEEAIMPQGSDLYVWRVAEGKVAKVKVRTGVRRDARVEIVDGVAAGDLVVTAGQLKLQRDGQEVRVVDPSKRPGATRG